MKKIIYTLALVSLFILGSCSKTLNLKPGDQVDENTVWTDAALIQLYVNNIYLGIPHGFTNIMMASLVDEAMYNADFNTSNVTKSLITPSDLILFSEAGNGNGNRMRGVSWEHEFKYVRATNLFLNKITKAPVDETAKNELTGEVHFLRAYLYFNLVSMYGGVPLITQDYGLDDDFLVSRNTFEECVNFIVKDCDDAAALLPLAQDINNTGRATKGAALALKARILLFAASDFYNSNASWAGGYDHPELVGYVGGDRVARWTAARDAALAVINLGQYDLYKKDPAAGDNYTKNYADIFLQTSTSEDIFVKFFTPRIDEDWHGYNPGLYNNPNGYHGWGSNCPTQQFIDAYEMTDGTPFSWNNPTEAADPYANRDPRFYASINYNGAVWRPRPSDVAVDDPVGIIQTGYWEKWSGAAMTTVAGLDTRQSAFENWNGTYTAYYLRKFIDPTVDAQFVKQTQPWRYIRYTEVLMNYAEACIALGQEADARTTLNAIRRRAGMPDITETGAALTARYRNERRIELAFEDQRYFDVRRWMIPETAYTDVQALDIRYKMNADHSTATIPTYSLLDVQQRAWKPRFYLLPISLDEMNRNNKLVQNPLY